MVRIFATVAIYKDGSRMIVNKSEVDTWLAQGWSLDGVESEQVIEEQSTAEEDAPRRRRRKPKIDNPFEI